MKKLIIAFTLVAFIAAGAFTVNKVNARVSSQDVKIEMVKFDQDPTKDGEKKKKDNKTTTTTAPASSTKAAPAKSDCAPSKTEGCAPKPSCTSSQKSCCSKSADPAKK